MNKAAKSFWRLFLRVFLPGIAKNLKQDGQFDLRDPAVGAEGVPRGTYIDVENNGSDVTLVCFAGMAALYGGMPRFEFRKTLSDPRNRYNFVWVRDIHRSLYELAPDGSPNGFIFFIDAMADALAGLHSAYTVGIGASGGGAAAFAFSGMLPIDQVIAFNPGFPLGVCSRGEILRRVILDWKKLLTRPRDYFELVLVVLAARYLWRRTCRLVGRQDVTDTLQCYLRKDPPARATLFYSARSLADAEQARPLQSVPSIILKPLDCGRHNCVGELKKRGELAALVHAEIGAGIAERRADTASLG
jgi:hypothetical protein